MVNLPNLPGLVGSLFSIIPTMLVLYIMLRRFDRFFEERRLLFALLFGLLVGAVVTLVEIVIVAFHEPGLLRPAPLVLSLVVLAFTYPLLETMGKLLVVNWHTYRGRRDTPYYAVGIGLGFAGVNVFIISARGVQFFITEAAQFTHLQIALHTTLLLILFTGGIMIHGFSTVVMGRAVAEIDVMRAFFYGALLLVPYYVGYWGLYALSQVTWIGFLLPIAAFVYGAFGVRYVIRHTLEDVVPLRERRRLLKEMERADREKAEEG